MTAEKSEGICLLCNSKVEYHSIAIHVKKCIKKDGANHLVEKEKIFLFKIWQRHADGSLFWLYIEINGSATLETLDVFLKKIWLNFNSDMASFNIDGEIYNCNHNLNKKIFRLFKEEIKFNYSNNDDSNTEIKGKVISERPGKLSENIRMIAKNFDKI